MILVLQKFFMFQIEWKRDAFDGLKRWLIFVYFVLSYMTSIHGSGIGRQVMRVGEELFREMLPLQNGARLYQLQGLRPHTWYEVKISYPASIPSAFTLQLSRGITDLTSNRGRKLLNTEKLIFKTDGMLSLSDQSETSVLVNVEPEGFVAIPGKREQEYVIFNIVCDELLLGIPHQAWYVAVLVLFCLMVAFAVPSFLPRYFMPENGTRATITKLS
ncbi:uncharacterized protein [Primulina huaijiensis]|uniref:uncharacterized protein isoform X2 n=1 Tax=Primulina huaijiensis TaxID=1492673 RepID=UPI003CC750A4